ncbi:hypothetical protein OLD53_03490 [Streptococcus pneumoniae]|nr:hypothetical protein [Streptococcus pneumoniae]
MIHVDDKLLLVAKKMCSPEVLKLYEFEYRNPQAVNFFNMIFGTIDAPFESENWVLSMFEGYFPKGFYINFLYACTERVLGDEETYSRFIELTNPSIKFLGKSDNVSLDLSKITPIIEGILAEYNELIDGYIQRGLLTEEAIQNKATI